MKLLSLIILSVAYFATCQAVCQKPTIPLTQLGEKYVFFEQDLRTTWYRARDICRSYGMQLTSINSEEENTAIAQMLINTGRNGDLIWIGGSDLGTSKTYTWIGTGQPISYSRFSPGQPDSNGGEPCLEIIRVDQNGPIAFWNDRNCRDSHYFICEWVPCTIC